MPIVGLDLGRHSFRAVELERDKGKNTLLKYGSYDNPRLNMESENKEDLLDYSAAVRDFFVETGFKTNNVVVSLPEQQVYMRIIKVPKMSDKDLKNSIQFEAEQYIPLPLKDVSLSYQKIDDDVMDKSKMNVELVAAKKTVLEKYVNILRGAKLVPKGIEPETLSLGRSLGDNEDHPSATVVLNVGYAQSLIIITYRGFVRFTRTLSVGGDTLTRAVAQGLSLDYLQAEEYKKVYGLDSTQAEGKIFNVLKPIFDNVILEVKRSKIFFTTHNPNISISRVVLSGGTALMPGLFFYMANNLDLEVELANPWKNIEFSEKVLSSKDSLFETGPLYSTAVGLSLKKV
jgi:type IV pilus assembly protein PilM